MPIHRLLLLACLLWLVSFVASPSAGGAAQTSKNRSQPAPGLVALHALRQLPLLPQQPDGTAGEDVSIGATWRSTMMANSAGIRIGKPVCAARRSITRRIQRISRTSAPPATCRWPRRSRRRRAARARSSRNLPIARANPSALHRLAADGISCTVCHQIAPDNLGTRDSFNANFKLLPTPADGARVIFGPYRIDAGRKTIMKSVTGFVQAEAPHIRQSELCASCHTLITRPSVPAAK